MYVPAMPANFPSPRWDLTCFAIVLSGRRCFHQQWHSDLVIMHHHWQHSWIRACSRLKFLITLMLDMLALTHACKCFGQLQGVRAAETLKTSHRPHGKIADVLAPTHACTTANTSVNYRRYVPQRYLKTSHCPNGKLMFCSLLAGRWCLCREWHGDLLIVHNHWQHSCYCACSHSIFPIAPMGNSRFALCLQGGGVYVGGGTVTISSCTISGNTAPYVRAHPQKFPMPPWENC
jgi:hypothetical protein